MMEFKPFGWQGLEFLIPSDWHTASEGGTFESGSLRIDEPYAPRIRLDWETIKEDKLKDFDQVLEDIKKKMRKKDKSLRFQRQGRAKICGHNARYFRWRSANQLEGYGLLWYCKDTKRSIVVEFLFGSDEYWKIKPAMEKAVETFQCHSSEEARLWTILDLTFKTTPDFKLRDRSFKENRMHFFFSSSSDKASFMIDRVTFAENILSTKYNGLEDWFEKVYKPELKRTYKGLRLRGERLRKAQIWGHDGLMLRSSFKIGLIRPENHIVTSKVWVCPVKDRIYAVTTEDVHRKKEDKDKKDKVNKGLELFLSSFSCH